MTVAFNTLYSKSVDAVLLRLALDAPAVLVDNLLAGAPVISLEGKARADQNMILGGGGMRDPQNLDFRLTPDSRAIDAGVTATADGQAVALPEWEYVHPRSGKPRRPVWLPDMGAHEFCAQDGGGFITLGFQNLSTAFTFGFHLTRHRLGDILGRRQILDLDAHHLGAPRFGGGVYNAEQARID